MRSRGCTCEISDLAGPSCHSHQARRQGDLNDPVSGTVLRVLAALVPLPSPVAVTCSPTSMHWPWFPPEDHINTGRLCSAGSESPTRSPTSKLVCSPPTPSPPSAVTSVPLASGLPPGASACSAEKSRWPARAPANAPVSEINNRLSVGPVLPRRGRASQVTRPSSSYVPYSQPVGCSPTSDSTSPRPYFSSRRSTERLSSPSRKIERSASGMA